MERVGQVLKIMSNKIMIRKILNITFLLLLIIQSIGLAQERNLAVEGDSIKMYS